MEQIIKWRARDGVEFSSIDECATYEVLCDNVEKALADLPSEPLAHGTCRAINSDIVIKFQREIVRLFRIAVPYLADDKHTLWAFTATRPAGQTLIGRYIDDVAPAPIRRAWFRVMCIDQQFREWSQPYYAIQADK